MTTVPANFDWWALRLESVHDHLATPIESRETATVGCEGVVAEDPGIVWEDPGIVTHIPEDPGIVTHSPVTPVTHFRTFQEE